ncbi:hypothetical protein JOF56_008708 [Kibdelosporangium banguiense]|uniref:Uncharacterized protein n=1 Tax=Kibdelosporangium banguiense TaxID=1365924 RepID=A0ABS4TV76_9PSEU|nr:hypothetical protein [Kibdelosporangium banguiense]
MTRESDEPDDHQRARPFARTPLRPTR